MHLDTNDLFVDGDPYPSAPIVASPLGVDGNRIFINDPKWKSSDETIATVTPMEDGLTGKILITGKRGRVIISVVGTDDKGERVSVGGVVYVQSGM